MGRRRCVRTVWTPTSRTLTSPSWTPATLTASTASASCSGATISRPTCRRPPFTTAQQTSCSRWGFCPEAGASSLKYVSFFSVFLSHTYARYLSILGRAGGQREMNLRPLFSVETKLVLCEGLPKYSLLTPLAAQCTKYVLWYYFSELRRARGVRPESAGKRPRAAGLSQHFTPNRGWICAFCFGTFLFFQTFWPKLLFYELIQLLIESHTCLSWNWVSEACC